MRTVHITGFTGVNNWLDKTAHPEPQVDRYQDASGEITLTKCINFDIDDKGGLLQRDDTQEIFTKQYDAKLTQVLGGRTFRAEAKLLRYTKPWSNEYEARRSSIEHSGPIVLIQEIQTGLWLSTSTEIYYHDGINPTKVGGFTQIAQYDFPAIMGTGEKVHASKLGLDRDGFVAVFTTTKGICYGDDKGLLVNMSEGVFSYKPGQRGISLLRENNGMVQYLVKIINEAASSFNENERKVAVNVETI